MDEPLEWLTLASNVLMMVTLVVLTRQVVIQRRSSDMISVEASYDRFLEYDRLAVSHPELQLVTVSSSVHEVIKGFDQKKLRKRAYIELILDVHELMYVRQKASHYRYQHDYLETLFSNPHVLAYWSEMRGNFRSDFEEEVGRVIERLSSARGNTDGTAPAPASRK